VKLLLWGIALLCLLAFLGPLHAAEEIPVLDLRDFKAKLITENLRALHEQLWMLDGAVGRAAMISLQWDADYSGRAISLAAIRAARRGVRVQIIIDAAHIRNSKQARLLAAMAHEGVEVYLFRPVIKAPLRANQRIHDKAIWVRHRDGKIYFKLGGRNKTDHFLLDPTTFDVDLLLVLDELQGQLVFDQQFAPEFQDKDLVRIGPEYIGKFWGAQLHEELREMEIADDFVRHLKPRKKDSVEVDVSHAVFARNRNGKATATHLIETLFRSAKKVINAANAYLIPDRELRDTLSDRLKNKVRMRFFSNSKTSTPHSMVPRLMEPAVDGLIDQGLELFLRNEGEVHAKAAEVDGQVFVVSSINIDPRSEFSDSQNALIVDSPVLAMQFREVLDEQIGGGEYASSNETDHFKGIRFGDRCLRLLLRPVRRFF
jgi:phosphatidylserine/phosphatidylglycerophosphate/cardiolipin synthase-like enzyme